MTNQETIQNSLVEYAANMSVDFEQFGNKEDDIKYLYSEFVKEWDNLPCDSEGFNKEQNKAADELIEKYTKEVMEIIK